jgi:membrane associated rhomboid family serine protease
VSDRVGQYVYAPWPSFIAAASIPLLYLFQLQVPDQATLIGAYGLSAAGLRAGQYQELLTFQIIHGSWFHVGGNAFFALLFAVTCGGAMTRILGAGIRGVLAFFAFYLFCGIISGVAFIGANLNGDYVVIGASGAVSGLIGASGRVFGRRATVRPVLSTGVFVISAAFLVLNFFIVFMGPLTGMEDGGMPVAWVTHLAGYLAGLFLIGPWAVVLGERPRPVAAPEPFAPELPPTVDEVVEQSAEPAEPLLHSES